MKTAFLNDQFLPVDKARVSVLDRGFLFGDGVYEVIPVFRGELFRLDQHLTRLQQSLDAIYLSLPDWPAERLTRMMQELVARNGGGNQSLYLQVTRGAQPVRDHRIPVQAKPTLFAMSMPMEPPPSLDAVAPVSCVLVDDPRWQRCDIKSISLLGNILARHEATLAGADEALLVRDGKVVEGSASNVFMVRDGQIITPPKNQWILGGITRDLLVELMCQNREPVKEADILLDAIRQADEIWISSSTREIRPVTRLDGQPVGDGQPGPVWRRVATSYQDFKRNLMGETHGH
jgi:D-alanine transaminase